ncbi:MAG: 50S ribosomal protein L13 [Candidatus Diapherotrites archaeon]|uniref:Large ribosomal subunit protein uL13 n=1 Tax=Candidatus Iainarchaeum sp. TaxID=3101447 RepID=A0A2D6M0L4_9ARCH|nr:50S ribosomal protein L13 [Candidatus Diapherotrites archaeon]|tara:strand:- start:10677 stop:11099 length:423 start_codon:yes stop_codon:yes gene_type:complete
MILINAEDLIVGRVASFCAKNALKGEEVVVVNAEKAILTGNKKDLLHKFQTRINLAVKGNPMHGPKAIRMPDRLFRRAIKGMLPTKRTTGKEAFHRVKVFIAVPEEFKDKKFENLDSLKVDKSKKYMVLGTLAKLLGATW